MSVMSWDEKYAIGIDVIDRQHQSLIRMINDLHEALLTQRGQEALGQIVGRMLDYTVYHFTTEELLLRKHGYEEYDAHRREHEEFTAKARELKRRVDGKGFVLTLEVLHFLRDWLANHILVNDRKYGSCLLGEGVR